MRDERMDGAGEGGGEAELRETRATEAAARRRGGGGGAPAATHQFLGGFCVDITYPWWYSALHLMRWWRR